MRNLVFFEALAATADLPDGGERDSLQKELTAAVIVLRLFADWVDSPAVMIGTPGTLANIKAAVADVPSASVRQLFETVVSGVARGFGDPTAIAAPLLAYAWLLEERDKDSLAEDVLITVVNAIEPLGRTIDYLFVATVNRRIGFVAHRRREFDSAEFHHRRQLTAAKDAGDTSMILDARINLATMQITRGNMGLAEAALNEIVEDAVDAGDAAIESLARRVRGGAMIFQRRPEDALREYYTAYKLAVDWIQREWLLADIASCALMLGLYKFAKTVYNSLSKTAHNKRLRGVALANLLEAAVLDDDRTAFDATVSELASYDLPREWEIYARLYTAMGVERWEGRAAGLAAYVAVAETATRAGVHEAAFQAAQAVERLRDAAQVQEAPNASGTFEHDWADLVADVEADCRFRLQAASTVEE